MDYLQQGDVLLKPATIPAQSKATDGNVLQEGEHTGHAHRLHGDGFRIYEHPATKRKHLKVIKGGVMLRHEEHKAFEVPPGEYEIDIVREYDHFEEETRQVLD